MEVVMKSIILILVSMVILAGCNMSFDPLGTHYKSPPPTYKYFTFLGKVIVKTESGKPCKYAKVVTIDARETESEFLTDSTGTVIIFYEKKKAGGMYSQYISGNDTSWVYKYYDNLNIKQSVKLYLTLAENWKDWDDANNVIVIFPDSP